MYKLIHKYDVMRNIVGLVDAVYRTADNAFIPFDPANTDYQSFLKWVADGNTPEPADSPTGGV